MKVNPLEKYPKTNALFTTVMTLVATYFGYEKVQEYRAQDVRVDVTIPDNHEYAGLLHTHKQKSWQREIDAAIAEHLQEYH
jgi:hypothetical protein